MHRYPLRPIGQSVPPPGLLPGQPFLNTLSFRAASTPFPPARPVWHTAGLSEGGGHLLAGDAAEAQARGNEGTPLGVASFRKETARCARGEEGPRAAPNNAPAACAPLFPESSHCRNRAASILFRMWKSPSERLAMLAGATISSRSLVVLLHGCDCGMSGRHACLATYA